VLDLDLTKVQALRTAAGKYQPLRRFPTSAFDVTVPVAERELAGNVLARLRESVGPLALEVRYLYDYKGDNCRSMTFRITLGAADRTLTGEEVTAVRSQVMRSLGL
jgi:phenylalanyl-tRNA synthetase beta chain